MDYFVYKREYKPEEWKPRSLDNDMFQAQALCFTCPDCRTKIWGVWEFPAGGADHYREPKAYLESRAVMCFTDGIDAAVQQYGSFLSEDRPHYQRIESYGKEAHEFKRIKVCPLCGERLSPNNLEHSRKSWSVSSELKPARTSSQNWPFLDKALASYKPPQEASSTCIAWHITPRLGSSQKAAIINAGNSKHEKFITKCTYEFYLLKPGQKGRCVLENAEQLMDYLQHVISIEKNIYSISERLKELYREEGEKEALVQEYMRYYNLHRDKQRISKKIAAFQLRNRFEAKRSEDLTKSIHIPSIPYPCQPTEPKMPNAPSLRKPGLFNKKRISAENAVLTEQHKRACEEYEEKLKIYNEEIVVYQQEVAKIRSEQEMLRKKAIEQAMEIHNEECKRLEQEYTAAQEEYKLFGKSAVGVETPATLPLKMVRDEIEQAHDLLRKLFRARQQIYHSGVVFEKYYDFVAIASFYEYLSSGRCTSLEGPHGAYNLYESEIRMNAIVSQLADVIKSLNQIQKNQFVIYTAISEATKELTSLNLATQKTNATLNAMHGELATISQNTEVTAFYAKKNAELMDTLCFLTALN